YGPEELFMSRIIAVGGATLLALGLLAADLVAQEPRPGGEIDFGAVIRNARGGGPRALAGPYRDFNEVTQGARKVEGLITLYEKGDHLYAEFLPHQLNQALLVPVTIARGMGATGSRIGDEEMVLLFRRVGDRIQLVRRNIHYKATPGSSLDKSVKQNYTDSVLRDLPVYGRNPDRGRSTLSSVDSSVR